MFEILVKPHTVGPRAVQNPTASETFRGKSVKSHWYFDDPGHNSIFVPYLLPPTTKKFGSRSKTINENKVLHVLQ